MTLKAKLSAALPFAHLLGLSAARAEDDEMNQRAEESDEDYAKRMEEEDKKQRDGESDEDYAKRMEEEDKKQRDGESDEDYAKRMEEEDKKQRDGESDEDYAKRMEGDDDGAGDDEKEKAARVSERARCAAIFASPAAGIRPDMAAHLAFSTDMSSSEAVKMLSAFASGAPAARKSLSSRMAAQTIPNPGASSGGGPAVSGPQAVAQQILAAAREARGEK